MLPMVRTGLCIVTRDRKATARWSIRQTPIKCSTQWSHGLEILSATWAIPYPTSTPSLCQHARSPPGVISMSLGVHHGWYCRTARRRRKFFTISHSPNHVFCVFRVFSIAFLKGFLLFRRLKIPKISASGGRLRMPPLFQIGS